MANEISLNLSASTSTVGLSDKSGRQAASSHSEPGSALSAGNVSAGSVTQTVAPPPMGSGDQQNKNALSAKQQETQRAELEKQAQKLQELSQLKGWKVDFSVDQDLKETVVKVIDSDTKTVIRQIPSEEMLALSKRIKALHEGDDSSNGLSGLLLDRQI